MWNYIVFIHFILVISMDTGGDHTRTRTVVTSKVSALAAFTTKKTTCLGCKAVLPAGEEKNPVCKYCQPKQTQLLQTELDK